MYKAKTELNFLLDIPVPSLSHCHHMALGELDVKILNAVNQLLLSERTDLSIKYDFILVMQHSVYKILGGLWKYSLLLLFAEHLWNFTD